MSKRVDDLEHRTKEAVITLEHLLAPSAGKGTRSILAEMLRRAEQPFGVDGYKTRVGVDPSGVGGGSGDLTSVEGAANFRMEDVCQRCVNGVFNGRTCKICGGSGKRWADPIGDAVHELVTQLGVIFRASVAVSSKTEAVMGSAARVAGRQNTLSFCGVPSCERSRIGLSGVGNDRLRNGWCPRCSLHFNSWRLLHRTSDPGADRVAFIAYMERWFAEQVIKAKERAERESREIDRLRHKGELPRARTRT